MTDTFNSHNETKRIPRESAAKVLRKRQGTHQREPQLPLLLRPLPTLLLGGDGREAEGE
eukprot:COSAG04_NODE_9242_length_883_cov_1.873724_3_plen_58_part_01